MGKAGERLTVALGKNRVCLIVLLIFGCPGSSLLRAGFPELW